jgi:hypothetical protein
VHAIWPLRIIILGLIPPLYLVNSIHDGGLPYSVFSILLSVPVCFKYHHVLHGMITSARATNSCIFPHLYLYPFCKKDEEKEDSKRKDNYSTFIRSKCNIRLNIPSINKISAVLWASVMHWKQYDFSVRFFPPRRLLLYIIMDAL